MKTFKVRVKGTINEEVEVEAEDAEQARNIALNDWSYVEFEDLWVDDVHEVA